MEQINFLKNTLLNFRTTGTITRSSSFLCKTMMSYIDFTKAHTILELGPGDGVITEYLLEKIEPGNHIYAFEINEGFLNYLQLKFANNEMLSIIANSAENMKSELSDRGITQVDYIVSAVPFTILPDELMKSIINSCYDLLRPGGKFIQFHYSLAAKKHYMKVFKNIQIKFVALNVPPAFVMVCEKL